MRYPNGDTIIAVATPPGRGGLAVIRLSGRKALSIAMKIFRPSAPRKLRDFPVRRMIFGKIGPSGREAFGDSAFAVHFRAPRSYTGEDVVEIFCHGSPVVVEEAVRLGIKAGARSAEAGEFTFRAFAGGRMDLLQAEALNDLIGAETPAQARLASRQLAGSLSGRIASIRRGLIDALARIEAAIEFPDDDIGLKPESPADGLAALSADVAALVGTYEAGRSLVEGVTLVLAGGRNTGKSTLFNALLGEERAIVTPQPGTTRDFIREKWAADRTLFHLVDTAGWGRPSSPAEKSGIEKSRDLASGADGLLIVLDRSRKETRDDFDILTFCPEKKAVLIFNKSDLPAIADIESLKAARPGAPALEISALCGSNLEKLRETILSVFSAPEGLEEEMILHGRQKAVFQDIGDALGRAEALLRSGHSEDIVAEEIRQTLPLIGRLTGEIRDDEILEDIFSRFCVGK